MNSAQAKEWLFRRTRAVGEALRSDVLVANAFHHRSDAWSSVAALAGIAGGHGLGVTIADPVAGVVVGGAVAYQGAKIARDAARELLDETLDGQRVARLERAVAAAVPRCDFSLRARKAVWKPNLQPDFNVRVCDRFDARFSAVLRELDESNRFVQKSAESTSI